MLLAPYTLHKTWLFAYLIMNNTLKQDIAVVKLVVFDVDGVLTNGQLYFSGDKSENRAFNIKDGHGIRLLLHYGVQVAVLSARESDAVSLRMQDLGVEHVYQGFRDKRLGFQKLLKSCGVVAEHVAYMGDDLPDIAPMKDAGFACAVADAHPEIIKCADWVSQFNGGCGAARELCDFLLKAQKRWDEVIEYCST